ncbi:aspartate carbamoyltransferase catalytic subunit [Paenibacillus polymyxa]|uniref:aspartate carbamoyltransferase catalytic subunit n=1 Tax=Paenibacillus TaxID=44249 RepID=UPI000ED3455E|nr:MULTISPECIES: aspartate carbamoyltransferase catalytic subunit [Paenibacillus]KAF6659142.1 aspartate carbamoyltransferase catalytic subunit [Paenibacillus sp. EKM301P]RGL38603.1 aspartate carbamoyltransferase catalytic subunit [Paenibacillus polymyxa]RPE01638.1 aspartate carbamoyltransferase catalytic subunit [Paenibacillus polymyxa]UBS85679.1 aspartate carbamoyltransferase catalytic subunit [Paenibacillus polymyxa]UMR34235.1 aspartate carbamoyltransferase catalytic subunit [Paenibacillus p
MITTASQLRERSLLGLKELSRNEIESILDRAQYWESQPQKLIPVLQSRFAANMFFENSTRTRFSFEMAEKRLGAQVLNFSAAASSVEKGESIYDTVRTLESMGIDAGVIRLKPAGVLQELAEKVSVPLVNAGDGNNEHPTQALLDLYTMRKTFGELKGLRVSIIGDILHSRVARSNLWALQKFGAEVSFCAPDNMQASDLATYAPYVPMQVALQADVVMMLRVQLERHAEGMLRSADEYREQYGLTEERAASLKSGTIIMHPAPVNRNVEIDSAVVESEQSRIFPQMANGVPIRMAVMERAMKL